MAFDPGNPDIVISAAMSAAQFGRSNEARALARRAVELDPLNPVSWSALAEMQYFEGQLAGAEADVKKSLELSSDAWPGPVLLIRTYIAQGRLLDALPEIERVAPDFARTYLYALTYAALDREKESDAALKQLTAKYSASDAYLIASVYAFRNRRDEAFDWLDRAYTQRDADVAYTNLDPTLKNLHADPRYAAFLKKIHLPVLP
jgi:tetratricopeptide (TPR) repeat protein